MRVENESRSFVETAREAPRLSGGEQKNRRSQWWILVLPWLPPWSS